MTPPRKRKPIKPATRPRKDSKKEPQTLDDLVVGDSLPRVKVRVFPSKRRNKNNPDDKLVVELQCEV